MSLKKKFLSLVTPPDESQSSGIDYFRNRLLFYLLVSLGGFGAIAYLPSVYYGFIYQFYWVVIIDTLALGWVFFLLTGKGMGYFRKSLGLLAVFYVLGVWLLISLGPTGAGFMWLLLFSIMAGVLLGFKAAIISFALNFSTIAGLSLLVFKQILTWYLIPPDELAIWTVKGVNFLCINAIVTVSTGFLITRISQMASREKQRRQTLAREIQARIRAEKENKALTFRLNQSQKMEAMGTLAGGIAHDFNNILTTIAGYAELSLLEPGLPKPVQTYLGHINRAGDRARGITHQILTFSRHAQPDKTPNDLGKIARECVELFKIGIPGTVSLDLTIPPQPFPILADKNQIFQVIMNLLTNGLQAIEQAKDTPQSRGRISLTIRPGMPGNSAPGNENQVCLLVEDTGKGIPKKIIPSIFDPYFTTNETGQGTGMGLSISHGIVKGHGGEILVESTEGKGTRFIVILPSSPRVEDPASSPGEGGLWGNEHILMVDDEPEVLDVQKRFLTAFGYKVHACDNPFSALELVKAPDHQFDLVVADRKMPGMTGIDLGSRISRIRPDLPLILCSGFPGEKNTGHFDAVLAKPVSARGLALAVRRVLDRENPLDILQDQIQAGHHDQGDKGGKQNAEPKGNGHGNQKPGLPGGF